MSKLQLVKLARDELVTFNIRHKKRKAREADEDIDKLSLQIPNKRRNEWDAYIRAVRDYDSKARELAEAQKLVYEKAKALAHTHNLGDLPPEELPDLE